ncbi:MarR family winged helix-turn-helix transcriptional regulator [Streptomyces canus]|uniref:MarR family winged helix-turn-helix transcriptional regulator n=1 Tax=Streptomyces canus TaxID=58343 RepID=UPI0033A70E7D
MPPQLRDLDLAPRHLALLAHLEYDGPAGVNELADRLEVAPTTVSLMVSELARPGILRRATDPSDRRRRIIAIAPDYTEPIRTWLSGSATAWEHVMNNLSPTERTTVVTALRSYETALHHHAQPKDEPKA